MESLSLLHCSFLDILSVFIYLLQTNVSIDFLHILFFDFVLHQINLYIHFVLLLAIFIVIFILIFLATKATKVKVLRFFLKSYFVSFIISAVTIRLLYIDKKQKFFKNKNFRKIYIVLLNQRCQFYLWLHLHLYAKHEFCSRFL